MSAWMSQAQTRLTRLPRIAENAVERARLTVVPRQRPRAPRVPFMILVSMVLLGGVVGLLLFNTSMQQASFRATALEATAAELHAREQSLRMEVDRLRDPQRVGTRAQELGMVPLLNPAFIRLSDGEVLGNPVAATPADGQRLTPLPARKPPELQVAPVIKRLPSDTPDSTADGVPSDVVGPGAGTTDLQE
jgi:cell division protein FtsB